MWFWEVLYKEESGETIAIRSSQGFTSCGTAFLAYTAIQHLIGETVRDVGGVVIVKEHIVYVPEFPTAIRDEPL